MTFNIWNYHAPWDQRRQLIADAILSSRPDAVALQETRHDFRYAGGKGQGDQLAELTGYYPTWALGQVYIPLLRVDEGLTILTRQPPLRSAICHLTRLPHEKCDENRRVCLAATIMDEGRAVHIFDTHFSLSEVARLSNARETAAFIREYAGSEPAILMGDLNALPDAPEIRYLAGQLALDGDTADFTDCWVAAHPNLPGYTYASWRPVKRIDYIFARNVKAVRGAETVGNQAVDGIYPSDHLGIVAELEV